jgi:hypothetical protein
MGEEAIEWDTKERVGGIEVGFGLFSRPLSMYVA